WEGFERDLDRWTYNALKVLEARYLIRDPEAWRFRETPYMLLWRVARAIASIEKPEKRDYYARRFFEILADGVFMPNGPTLMNAGTPNSMLSACFVIPVRDALTTPDGEGILDALRAQAIIQKHGGGTGFSFTELRPKWDPIHTTGGTSSGPLSFMKLFDTMTDVVKQGGKRRGANMGIMEVWHADIRDFIKAKTGELRDVNLQNFNISVMVTDDFMYRALAGLDWPLVNPRKTSVDGSRDSRKYAYVKARHYFADDWVAEFILDELEKRGGSIALDETRLITFDEAMAIAEHNGADVDRVDARDLLLEIVEGAWDSGDPGIISLDTVNARHPVWYLDKVNSTNPCSEAILRAWEPCNLGSINLAKLVRGDGTIDYERLEETIRFAVRFLDNVIDVNRLPIDKMERANKETRKIGLGVMGWAHLLMKLGIPYASVDALYLAWHLSDFIARVAIH
ncbi:MAG TPA: adenosylcobalamin-dependent ribonucleoside-diphosphate reductase, partial [Pyrodictium sp.]|nr:adenosylcobalamin-dependent ribonucleoside-diphosphate reductase [Pyrodictium sp.]